jgi:hypothetical protein
MAKRNWFLVLIGIVLVVSVISTGVFSAKRKPQKKQWPQEPRVTSMPQVYSQVKGLEVVRAWIVRQDTDTPAASIEIRNNSNKDALAVDVVCGEGAITRNGLHDDEHPIVVVKAHETLIMEMNFSEMTFGAPLVVSAVTYADGTEEGDERSLRSMHAVRERDRALLKAKKEAQGGATKP